LTNLCKPRANCGTISYNPDKSDAIKDDLFILCNITDE
jgi:hypothetical protein